MHTWILLWLLSALVNESLNSAILVQKSTSLLAKRKNPFQSPPSLFRAKTTRRSVIPERPTVPDLAAWDDYHHALAPRIIKKDQFDREIQYIGGVDVSYFLNEADGQEYGVGVLAIVDYQEPSEIVHYEQLTRKSDMGYRSGYLGIRELPIAEGLIRQLMQTHRTRKFYPQVLLVDGNGYFHQRRCGLATEIGIALNIPTIGVSKSLLKIEGITEKALKRRQQTLHARNGDQLAKVIYTENKSCENARPIFVSIGHRVNLDTAYRIVQDTRLTRVPEPIRRADELARQLARIKGKQQIN